MDVKRKKNVERARLNADCLRNHMSQPVLSSPFSYRLLYKTHKRLNPRSYKPFLSSRIRRKRDQHRGAGSLNLNSISPRSFPPLRESGPDQSSRPSSLSRAGESSGEAPRRGIRPPLRCVFSSAHVTASCGRDFGPRPVPRVRVAHPRASDTAVTNDIVESGVRYSRGPAISSSRGRRRRRKYCRVRRGPRRRRTPDNTWPVDRDGRAGSRVVVRTRASTHSPTGQYFRRRV